MTRRILPMGDAALLVELGRLEEVLALSAALRREPVPGQLDVIPAARTVLVRVEPGTRLDRVAMQLRDLEVDDRPAPAAGRHEIPVVYDGTDLAEVAELLGTTPGAVVDRHTAATWTVAFTGFAPGFAYLVSPDAGLRVPRRPTPRTSVPAGSVALADEFSGIYPRQSPGGWQLIGRTDAVLWDTARNRPALLEPGDAVRFRPVRELLAAAPARPAAPPPTSGGLTVLHPGFAATVQDRGRPGWGHLGVSPSGAADRRSYAAANEAVGNRRDAAALEITLGGLRLRADRELVAAVTGAAVPITVVDASGDERVVACGAAFVLRTGEVLELGVAEAGLRSYVAVRGGIAVPAELGSRSTDTLSRLGAAPLRAGDVLPVGDDIDGAVPLPLDASATEPPDPVVLRYRRGPRHDWLRQESLRVLEDQTWTVGTRSDRVALRLDGSAPLERSRPGELPSEGMVAGALQVPPDGRPVLFLADHPVTGGYPVIGVVVTADLPLAAQLPPGSSLRFRSEEGRGA